MKYLTKIVTRAIAGALVFGLLGGYSLAATPPKTAAVRATVYDDAGKPINGVMIALIKSNSEIGMATTSGGGFATFAGVQTSNDKIYLLRVAGESATKWRVDYITLPSDQTHFTCPLCTFSVPGPTDRLVNVKLASVGNGTQTKDLIIRGVVSDDKTWINGATVSGRSKQTTTKDVGQYTLSISNTKVGDSFALTAVAGGYKDGAASVKINSDSDFEKNVNFRLVKGTGGTPDEPPLPPPKPKIGVDSKNATPQEIDSGKGATGQWFTVFNEGEPRSVLNYTVSGSAEWLTLTGDLAGSSNDSNHIKRVNITFPTAASLAIGDYHAALTISDPDATNTPRTVDVYLKVKKPLIKFGDVWHSLIYGNIYDQPLSATNYCNRTKGVAAQKVRPKPVSPYGIAIIGIGGNITINPEFYNSWQCVAFKEEDGKYKSAYQIKYQTNAVPSLISMTADKINKSDDPSGADEYLGSVEVTPSAALGKDGQPNIADVRFYAYGDLFHKENIDPKIQPIPIDYVKMRINIIGKITDIETVVGKVPVPAKGTSVRGGGLLGGLGKIVVKEVEKRAAEKLAEAAAARLNKNKDTAQKPSYADGYLVLTRNKAIRDRYLPSATSATISHTELEALKGEINQAKDIIVYTNKAPINTWLWEKEPTYPFFIFKAANSAGRHIISKLQGIDIISSEESAGAPPQTSVVRKIEPKIDANGNLVSIEEYLPKPYADGEQVVARPVTWIPNTGKQFSEEAE